jgi:subtilase family serine protease
VLFTTGSLRAQSYSGGQNTRSLIAQPIDENQLVSLPGNTHPAATPANDRGAVSDSLPLEHLQLQLQRPPELEQKLENFMAAQQRWGSPVFHHWLTADQFGQRFGVSPPDIEKIRTWLEFHGFQVNAVLKSGMVIEFSGNARQIKEAFHTQIHNLEVKGEPHIANMSDPRIPVALAGVIKGVTSLHDFKPHTMFKKRPEFTFTCPTADCGPGVTFFAVVPSDLATIYNLNPAFAAGFTGTGQTIVVIEDTLLKNTSDVATFRSAFGLSGYSGTFTQEAATGAVGCGNPGVNGAEVEAALDAEWAGASAPPMQPSCWRPAPTVRRCLAV